MTRVSPSSEEDVNKNKGVFKPPDAPWSPSGGKRIKQSYYYDLGEDSMVRVKGGGISTHNRFELLGDHQFEEERKTFIFENLNDFYFSLDYDYEELNLCNNYVINKNNKLYSGYHPEFIPLKSDTFTNNQNFNDKQNSYIYV